MNMTPPDTKPSVDETLRTSDGTLQDMVTGLHEVYLSQQISLAELTNTITCLTAQVKVLEAEKTVEKEEGVLLRKEHNCAVRDIQRLEMLMEKQSSQLHTLVSRRNQEICEREGFTGRLERLERERGEWERRSGEYQGKVGRYREGYVDDVELEELERRVQEMEGRVKEMRQEEEELGRKTGLVELELGECEVEDQGLERRKVELRGRMERDRSEEGRRWEEVVREANRKIGHYQGVHSAHKNQLRELNRVIAAQKYR